jgi:hypothetical protein
MLPIVIVDDSREDAMLAVRVLKECKIVNPIIVLKSGEECIDFLTEKASTVTVLCRAFCSWTWR